jgi:hypothetical protein
MGWAFTISALADEPLEDLPNQRRLLQLGLAFDPQHMAGEAGVGDVDSG